MSVLRFEKGVYYEVLWFVSGEDGDWLAAVFRDEAVGPEWRATYRFRWEKEDGKRVWSVRGRDGGDATLRRIIDSLDEIAELTAIRMRTAHIDRIVAKTDDVDWLVDALASRGIAQPESVGDA